MDYDTFYEFLETEGPKLALHVVPIFYAASPSKAEFYGTATYVNLGPICLLVTAAHVLTEIFEKGAIPLVPLGREFLGSIPCDEYAFSSNPTVDLAVCRLTGELPLHLPVDLERAGRFSNSDDYQNLLIGFPSKGVKVREGHVLAKYEGYQTQNSPPEEYKRLSADPERFCVFEFRKEKVYRKKLRKENFPDPNGMSGGPVFQFPNANARDLRLVGIMIRWDTERKKAIVAVRIEELRRMFTISKLDKQGNGSPTS